MLCIQARKLSWSRIIESAPCTVFVQEGAWDFCYLLSVQSLHTSDKRREQTDWWESKKCNESCCVNQCAIRDGSCDYITKVMLILVHWARAGHNSLNNSMKITFVAVLLRANHASSFIHSSWWFHVHQIRGAVTEGRITSDSPQHVWV